MIDQQSQDVNDQRLHRVLGPLSLGAFTFTAMVGSGWLFAAYYAAQIAGPLSMVSWVIAGAMTLIVSLVYIELSVVRPLSGGNIRWPQQACGPLLGAAIGWLTFLQVAVAAGSEVAGLLQYGAHWWPALYADGSLTVPGLLVGLLVNASFTLVAWWGLKQLARLNNFLTIPKLVIPLATIALLTASGFDSSNFTGGPGWAPNGMPGVLNAVVTGGLIYSFGGIYHTAQMSGEVKNPARDIPLGTLLGLGAAFVLYLGLQLAYLGALPHAMLEKEGWSGINFNSPFAQLAFLLNLGWLGWLLVADGVYSPAVTQYATTGMDARSTYGIAQNRTFPSAIARVHTGSGVPRNALLLNFVVGSALLIFYASWHNLTSALGMFFAIGYAIVSVTVMVFRRQGLRSDTWISRTIPVVAPVSFTLAGMIVYWSGWPVIRSGFPLLLASLVVYALVAAFGRTGNRQGALGAGLWFFEFMAAIAIASLLGSFGGHGWLKAPWDSLIVGLISFVYFWRGARAGARWMTKHDESTTAETIALSTDGAARLG
ncbi:APC family permease [Streptomyces sp. NPDC052043]|uniref:APC family permease n=1 Tax=Streptomyces sp. NPDC052043 TaxID=3365684 RepID=UPI0037D3DE27